MSEKKIIAERTNSRASTGLYFLEDVLTLIHRGGTDGAFSRSIYILFSYNFELILKTRIILAREDGTRDNLTKGLRHHDLEKLSQELSPNELKDIDIQSVVRNETTGFIEYEVTTIDGEKIVIQDLIDVRYDFMKDFFRGIDPQESARMKQEIDIMLKMVKKNFDILRK